MLAYNGGTDAIEAIKSLADQRPFIDQIFISDNQSNDGSREQLLDSEEELGFKTLTPNDNYGFAGGFNLLFDHALSHSSADYFLVLNNDTEATPDFLRNLLKEAQPDRVISPMILWHKDKDTVIQCAGDFDHDMIKMKNHFADKSKTEISPEPKTVEQTDGCCFLVHRKWLEKGLRFDPDLFIYFEDVDFFLRLKKQGVSFHYIPESVLYHKEYGSSGDRDTPSPFRNYYFYRNRMIICQRIHKGFRKVRVYWRLIRLAISEAKRIAPQHPLAAKAIHQGLMDFFIGNLGKRYVPQK
jgi:GT2 family glycosyltransferase